MRKKTPEKIPNLGTFHAVHLIHVRVKDYTKVKYCKVLCTFFVNYPILAQFSDVFRTREMEHWAKMG